MGSHQPSTFMGLLGDVRHRGPDDEGVFCQTGVSLGHRRLAIVDVAHGQQPFFSHDGRVALVANGEIYNYSELRHQLEAKGYVFRTHCDIELLPYAYDYWGLDFVDQLAGMFAIAIWDGGSQHLHLIRDRLGIKPLYYTATPKRLAFCSEMMPLVRQGLASKHIQLSALQHTLIYQDALYPQTIFQDIAAVEPGQCHSFNLDRDRVLHRSARYYWRIDDQLEQAAATAYQPAKREALDQSEELLIQIIDQHTLSDVPLGLFLSGGIDSSLLLALLRKRYQGPLHSFTVGWPHCVQEQQDESALAQAVANRFGSQHTTLMLPTDKIIDVFSQSVAAMDQPCFDGLNTYLISQQVSQHVKVAFSGLGLDELFHGYSYTYSARRLRGLAYVLKRLPDRAINALLLFSKTGRRRYDFPNLLRSDLPEMLAYIGFSIFSPPSLQRLMPHTAAYQSRAMTDVLRYSDLDHNLLAFSLKTYLVNPLLRITDVMSMRHSLEVRVPYLDHRFVEYAMSLPRSLRWSAWQHKVLPRSLAQRHLPKAVLGPKKGFTLPVHRWLKAELLDLCREMFEPGKLEALQLFDAKEVQRIHRDFLTARCAAQETWMLLIELTWLSQLQQLQVKHVGAND